MRVRREIGLLMAAALPGCGSSHPSTIDPNVTVSASYSSIAQNILTPGCVGCHGGSGGYSFDSYSNTLHAVTAGNPSSSPLYGSMNQGTMPKDGTHPSAQQIQAVRDWIAAGALNN